VHLIPPFNQHEAQHGGESEERGIGHIQCDSQTKQMRYDSLRRGALAKSNVKF